MIGIGTEIEMIQTSNSLHISFLYKLLKGGGGRGGVDKVAFSELMMKALPISLFTSGNTSKKPNPGRQQERVLAFLGPQKRICSSFLLPPSPRSLVVIQKMRLFMMAGPTETTNDLILSSDRDKVQVYKIILRVGRGLADYVLKIPRPLFPITAGPACKSH